MLKGARWALRRSPGRLSEKQKQTLAAIQAVDKSLYRAYLLKEQLREIDGHFEDVLAFEESALCGEREEEPRCQ